MSRTAINVGKLLFTGIYRGICVNNRDPNVQGRIKVHVPGVFPEELAEDPTNLPWALPVMPIFGGSYQNPLTGCLNTETGISSSPLTINPPYEGAQLAVYFENGNHLNPVYFGAFQCGPGWLAKNNEQHVIQTKNVTIMIDESPISGAYNETSISGDSSLSGALSGSLIDYKKTRTYSDSNNKNCTYLAKNDELTRKKMPTTVNIKILNNMDNGCALNIALTGTLNVRVSGDVYEENIGNKYETVSGDFYRMIHGDFHEVINGANVYEKPGNIKEIYTGDYHKQVLGDARTEIKGQLHETIGKNRILEIQGLDNKTVSLGCTLFNKGMHDVKNLGASSESNYDSNLVHVAGNRVDSTGMTHYQTDAMGLIHWKEGLFGSFEWNMGPKWELNTCLIDYTLSLVPLTIDIKLGLWIEMGMCGYDETIVGPIMREWPWPVVDIFDAGYFAVCPNIMYYDTASLTFQVDAICTLDASMILANSVDATLISSLGFVTMNAGGVLSMSAGLEATLSSLVSVGIASTTAIDISAGSNITMVGGTRVDIGNDVYFKKVEGKPSLFALIMELIAKFLGG